MKSCLDSLVEYQSTLVFPAKFQVYNSLKIEAYFKGFLILCSFLFSVKAKFILLINLRIVLQNLFLTLFSDLPEMAFEISTHFDPISMYLSNILASYSYVHSPLSSFCPQNRIQLVNLSRYCFGVLFLLENREFIRAAISFQLFIPFSK